MSDIKYLTENSLSPINDILTKTDEMTSNSTILSSTDKHLSQLLTLASQVKSSDTESFLKIFSPTSSNNKNTIEEKNNTISPKQLLLKKQSILKKAINKENKILHILKNRHNISKEKFMELKHMSIILRLIINDLTSDLSAQLKLLK